MKRLLTVTFLFAVAVLAAVAGSKGEDTEYRYEIESYDGKVSKSPEYRVVKVWNYGKKEKLTRDYCMKAAVHGIMFKGYAASDKGSDGGMKAICSGSYDDHREYYDNFFNSGSYLQFVTATNNGSFSPGDIIKIDKKTWKVGMVVKVNVVALRKKLSEDGVAKSLGSFF